ncbi:MULTISPECIES: helix-turn-helix domain-containing protein [Nostoc]|uniref:Helix-turn-helix transcriptional regulator n=1 Tax=Nostoc paludosum FACHB-159 TaxID=2692908 RepID=A0ABR8K7D2_9NOSO|nr:MULTISPECIES: helix-turn-helix domain-containing protein [Nostoc]MBD2678802.1 helix-turn-helix transcriptional regulator [Nostoc sp. FACHB-857]MBD2734853.1 helix-turn-helix transcriptional regulator [Nostoc paludosum FACHB-159]
MDEQLKKLIDEVCCYPDPSPERQKALNRLLIVIQQLPGIYKSGHQDYLEALNLTWEWVSRKICAFEARSRSDSKGVSPSLQQSLVIWINGYLKWRIKDLYIPDSNYTISLDRLTRNDEGDQTSLLNILPDPQSPTITLDLLDIKIAQIQENQRQSLGKRIRQYIEQDEEGKLTASCLRKNPECHCQLLTMRLLLENPPHKISDIARDLNISNQTLYSHWKKNCLPLLREIGINFGYE